MEEPDFKLENSEQFMSLLSGNIIVLMAKNPRHSVKAFEVISEPTYTGGDIPTVLLKDQIKNNLFLAHFTDGKIVDIDFNSLTKEEVEFIISKC